MLVGNLPIVRVCTYHSRVARSNDRKGFEEAQARFGFAFDLAAYYESYRYRCAFTAQDLRAEIDADPLGPLLRLLSSGELRADLVIPACTEARQAYAVGAISIGANYDILISARRCQQTLHDRLSRHGLLLPTLEQFYPNLRVLADHAEDFVAGRFTD
jgi:hypothetical protein